MEIGTIFLVAIIVYVLILAGIGVWAYQKGTRNVAEYYLAGRSLGMSVFAFAVVGSIFSAWYFLGNQGMMWAHGLAGASWYFHTPFLALAAWILWRGQWVLSKKHNFVTAGDILGSFYESRVVRFFVALLACLYALPYVAAQMWGAGHLLEVLTEGAIPFEAGAFLLAGIIGFYVILGGLRSTAWTSFLQGVLLISGGIVILGIVIYNVGLTDFWVNIKTGLGPEFITLPGPVEGFPWRYAVTFGFVTAFGIPCAPVYTLWVNSIPGAPHKIFRFWNFVMIAVVMGFVYFFMSVLTGTGARMLIPELAAADQIIPALMHGYMPWFLYIIVGVAAVAAAQSTSDIALHTASTAIMRDIIRDFNRDISERAQTNGARIITFVLLVLAILVARSFEGFIAVWSSLAVSFGLMLLPAWIGAIYWPRATSAGVVAGILVGTPVVLITFFAGMPLQIHAGFWGLAANVIVFLIVTYMTDHPSMNSIRNFHGVLKKEIYGK